MDKFLLSYINRESDTFAGELTITREVAPNGSEYVRICLPDDRLLYDFWHNPNKPKRNSKNPKHAGGRKPYLMLMSEEVSRLRGKGIKDVEELIGYLASLGEYIEWNTGRLIHTRSKSPLQYKDLLEIYKCSKPKLNKMLGKMREHELLYHTDEGYHVSSKLIKKGKVRQK